MSRKIFQIDQSVADSIYKLGLMGKTNAEIAQFLGVAERTLYNHLLKNPQVMQALKNARARAAADVVVSPFSDVRRRGTGISARDSGGGLSETDRR